MTSLSPEEIRLDVYPRKILHFVLSRTVGSSDSFVSFAVISSLLNLQ